MKCLFTVNAGEYLVGDYIAKHYRGWNVWLPSKDEGIDLLVTDSSNRRSASLQVKYSTDFADGHARLCPDHKVITSGWWTLDAAKIDKSEADFWVFVVPSFGKKNEVSFIIIPPKELLRRLRTIHKAGDKRIHSYLSVTSAGCCFETRDPKGSDFDGERDFSKFLSAWGQIEKKLE